MIAVSLIPPSDKNQVSDEKRFVKNNITKQRQRIGLNVI
jgi:hypothetical protein